MAIAAIVDDEPSLIGLGEKKTPIGASEKSPGKHAEIFDPRAEFALRTRDMNTEVLDTILKLSSQPEIISFAGGLVGVLQSKEVKARLEEQVARLGPEVRNYASTEGYEPLREVGAELFRRLKLEVRSPEDVIINSGGQQSLDLIGKILINQGDTVVTESPTYPGALQAWLPYGARIVPIETDDKGMSPVALEKILKDPNRRIPFIYLIENYQNPGGFQTSWDRKVKIAELAQQYNVRVVADDPYKLLLYEGGYVKPIQSILPGVIEIMSTSKMFEPAARQAFVTASADVIRMMIKAKQGADLFGGHEGQARLYYYLASQDFPDHIYKIREVYVARRNAMMDEMDRLLPGWIQTRAMGGMFLYAQDPEGRVNTSDLLPIAAERGVAFVPGAGCYPPEFAHLGEHGMRLNFTFKPEDQIKRGVSILAEAIREYRDRKINFQNSVE